MPPTLALFLWVILLLALLFCDPAREPGTSLALWVPSIWMFIMGTRLPAQWLAGQYASGRDAYSAAETYQEGNPLDRSFFLVLILLSIGILISRSLHWSNLLTRNLTLTAFLFFALVSVCWSDYTLIAFKRWFRDLGNYLVVLVVLSDPRPLLAVRAVLRRLGYLILPLSVILIKYYPQIGRQYDSWTGAISFVGATTSKNMLGLACLVSGLFFFWDTGTRWSERKQPRIRRIIFVNIFFLAMTLWLLHWSSSATSQVCLALGCLVIAGAHLRSVKRNPAFVKVLIPTCFCLYVILAFGFNINGELAGAVGRDPTLTDRTKIWAVLLSMHTNPMVGTGYESFWLGSRLAMVWQRGFKVNEAHNGYLGLYLNLGMIGVLLVVGFLITSYRTICRRFTSSPSLASLFLAVWSVLLFYNMTEAALGGGLLWMILLMGAIPVTARTKNRVHAVAPLDTTSLGTPRDFRSI